MSGPFTELSNAQIISYATMASGAAVMYDQILNFSQEVDFIWVRRWTIVTALYFVARYCGPVSQFAVVAAVLPLNWTPAVNTSLAIVYRLSSIASVTAMQGVFLLRAHALCNRSRKVLVFLSVSFVCEMVVMVVVIVKSLELVAIGWLVTFMGPDGRVLIGTNATLDLWQQVSRVIQLVYDILLLVFALFGSVKHALEARGWCVNPLVKALAEDQIAYIFWYVVSFLALSGVHSL
ncbi:hypothetical protein BV22DRAFT_500296 [Leucogyrophana mollusca]|uniref:Uncharacterized protein n=1 Tax=Leucogyrophana mollusca TaxID=85980 RepID=A0ACB8BFG9_9AGAM|nr:hypothetical protein BV22DRAFT_500296 [Leucogyrophana mollusca]